MYEFILKRGKDNYAKCDGLYTIDRSKNKVNRKSVYVNHKKRRFLAALGNTGWCITDLHYWGEVKTKKGSFGGYHKSKGRYPHSNGWINYTVKVRRTVRQPVRKPAYKPKVAPTPPGKKFDSRTKKRIIASLDNALRSLTKIDRELAVLIKHLVKHQKAIRATKWGTAATSIASTILCFTPFAALGVAGLAATSVAGAGATIGDTHVTRRSQKKVEALARQARIAMQHTEKALKYAMKVTFSYGKSLNKVTRFAGMAAAGKIGISTASKALAGIGAALSVASAISAQVKDNPSLQNARKLQRDIKQQYRQIANHKANIQRNL